MYLLQNWFLKNYLLVFVIINKITTIQSGVYNKFFLKIEYAFLAEGEAKKSIQTTSHCL